MPETRISKIKTKLCNACEKYCNIKVRYAQRKIISNLSKRDDIVILKQDTGRVAMINFETDPTKTFKTKAQRTLRKNKSKVSEQEYKWLYSTGLFRGKFYGTAKMHKLFLNGNAVV